MKNQSIKIICFAITLFSFLMITIFPNTVCLAKASNVEIQAEYLRHHQFGRRFFTRAHGYTTDDDIRRKSNAVGLGPAVMIRWERPISGKLYGDLEFSGSFLIYNKSFPAQGRPWGFLWRIGPRLTWKYTKSNSISLGYMFSHSSNGMQTKNPGHNSFGFSLGFNHSF